MLTNIDFLLPRVHGNEDTAVAIELDLRALEDKPFLVERERLQHAQYLLGHYGQHVNVDAVEFVETTPAATLRDA